MVAFTHQRSTSVIVAFRQQACFDPLHSPTSTPSALQNVQGLDGAKTLSDLAGSIPSVVSTFLGYSVIPQVLSENQLTDKPFFNTTNRLKQGNSVNGAPVLQSLSFKTENGVTEVRPTVSCLQHSASLGGHQDAKPCSDVICTMCYVFACSRVSC